MSRVEVDKIQQQCGTTLTVGGGACKTANIDATTVTIGRCGGTVSLASGATQSGFGSPGQLVDWQTGDIKTTTFTAVDGKGYFCNTSGGAFTVNLPAGSAGAIVSVADYSRSFAAENLTIAANGSEKIGGIANDAVLEDNGQAASFVYVDSTQGWINVQETNNSITGQSPYIVASGGAITECGNCRIHTFTGPGTFTVCKVATTAPAPVNNTVSYMVVAGGGGGGAPPGLYSGGAGAGGFREDKSPVTPYTASPLDGAGPITVTAQGYPITVGGGGAVQVSGNDSIFSSITSAGGGNGGRNHPATIAAGSGGSGGGLGQWSPNSGSAGSGNTPPTSPSQGNPGAASTIGGGGGGGATASGSGGPSTNNGGPGGAGATTSISGSPTAYAGGGGGSAWNGTGGTGGTGGGGNGSTGGTCAPTPAPQTAGSYNTGGGGGSGGSDAGSTPGTNSAGGSGIIIIRYKYQ